MRVLNSLTGQYYDDGREKIEKRELADIELTDVSLVRKGANKKKFLFFKSADDGSCIDLLDTIEAIEENYSLSAEESEHIEKALKTLNVLDSEDVEALSNVILLLSKLIATEPDTAPVSKQAVSKLWPSFEFGTAVSKSDEEEPPVMSEERAKASLESTFGPVGHESESLLGDD